MQLDVNLVWSLQNESYKDGADLPKLLWKSGKKAKVIQINPKIIDKFTDKWTLQLFSQRGQTNFESIKCFWSFFADIQLKWTTSAESFQKQQDFPFKGFAW